MGRSRIMLSAAAVFIALTGLGAPALAGTHAASLPPPGKPPVSHVHGQPLATYKVTLVTGDVVTAVARPGGGYMTSERPGPGRRGIRFFTSTHGSQVSVVPSDAEALLQAGQLDPRLFDVSALISMGYDDHRSPSLGLIAQRAAVARPAAMVAAHRARYLAAVHADALQLPRSASARAWRALTGGVRPGQAAVRLAGGISRLWLDARLSVPALRARAVPANRLRAREAPADTPPPPSTMPLIGVPAARAAGLTGQGVTVAVLDTGYDQNHPDLAGVVSAAQNFTADPSIQDVVGHGTHVSSIIAGSGAASGGIYQGVAPDARLAEGKVCESVPGTPTVCPESDIIAGISWAVNTVHAQIVNISLGGPNPLSFYLPAADPLTQAVAGNCGKALFVIAAGNGGASPDQSVRSVWSPGIVPCALTVGAIDRDLSLAPFSSIGPVYGTGEVKPDVTAPGVDVVAALAAGSEFASDPSLPEFYNGAYVELSGTSMATPHVAGAAALLLQQHPGWSVPQLRAALTSTASTNPALGPYQQGTGLISLARAISQPVVSTETTLNYALSSPHPVQQAATRTLAYTNTGSSPLLLTPSIALTGQNGVTAPAGLVSATPTPGQGGALLLAPGATGTVAVTVHGAAAPVGIYDGLLTLTSSDGQVVLEDPVSADLKPPLRDVSVTVTDVHGNPVGPVPSCSNPDPSSCEDAFGAFYRDGLETGTPTWDNTTGVVHVKLPPGNYEFAGGINYGPPYLVTETDWFFAGVHVRNQSVTVKVGSTTAVNPLNHVDDPTVDYVNADTQFGVGSAAGGGWSLSAHGDQVIPEPDPGSGVNYFSMTSANQAGTNPAAAHYSIFNYLPGNGVPASLSTTVPVASMARLHDTYLISGRPAGNPQGGRPLGAYLYRALWATLPYVTLYGSGNGPFQPTTYDDFVSGGPQLTWYSQLTTTYSQNLANYVETGPIGVLQPGQVVNDTWNQSVLGPVSPYCARLYGSTSLQCGNVQPLTDFSPARHVATDTSATGTATLSDAYGYQLAAASLTDGAAQTMPSAPVSPQPGRFTLTETAALPATPSRLSTSVNTTWTFTSEPGSDTYLLTPRIDPAGLDANGGALTGSSTPVTVYFQRAATLGGAPFSLTGATVEVSFDDGTTWQRLPVTLGASGANPYRAPSAATSVTNPAMPGFASIRVTGTDNSGQSVNLTVLRAYQIVAPGQ